MAKTIRIEDWAEAAQTEITLSGERQMKLHRPAFRARNQVNWAARRPGWGNAKAATTRFSFARALVSWATLI